MYQNNRCKNNDDNTNGSAKKGALTLVLLKRVVQKWMGWDGLRLNPCPWSGFVSYVGLLEEGRDNTW